MKTYIIKIKMFCVLNRSTNGKIYFTYLLIMIIGLEMGLCIWLLLNILWKLQIDKQKNTFFIDK